MRRSGRSTPFAASIFRTITATGEDGVPQVGPGAASTLDKAPRRWPPCRRRDTFAKMDQSTQPTPVNRAPVLTLWAAVVAERCRFQWNPSRRSDEAVHRREGDVQEEGGGVSRVSIELASTAPSQSME